MTGDFTEVRLTLALGCHQPFPRGALQSLAAVWTLTFFLALPRGSGPLVCVSLKNLFIHFVVRIDV